MTRQTTRLTQLVIIALLLTIFVGSQPAEARPAAAPALQTITVDLENFSGEGSFMDGYDFSAQAVQRYGEEGPDRPELVPDFYYSEGYPIAGPIGFDIVNTIDFGAVGLETVTTAPDAADPRFGQSSLSFGHTYGLYTMEGQFVAFQVNNVYEEPYDDWHIEGITIVWKQLGAPPVGELIVTVDTYQASYQVGEHPTIHGMVTADGQPVEGVWVTIWLFDQQGNTLWGLSIQTGEGGGYMVPVTYGEQIPTGYSGWLTVTADVTHQEAQAHATTTFGYAMESGEGLELTLRTDKSLYLVDEEVRITLRATFDDEPVQGVYVTFRAYDEAGAQLASVYAETDANGEIESNLTLPGQQGVVRITAEGEYGLSTASAERRITFGPSNLTLVLSPAHDASMGPEDPIEVGDPVGIGGAVTYLDRPVEDAAIQITVRGQTYNTHTDDKGYFSWYFETGTWPAGEYTIQVSASVAGSGLQPATGSVSFTLLGIEYDRWAELEVAEMYDLGSTVVIPGQFTLGGNPAQDWIEVTITRPGGRSDTYVYQTEKDGSFEFEIQLGLAGEYTLAVYSYPDEKLISQEYTFHAGGPPTPPPPTPEPTFVSRVITDVVYFKDVEIGDVVEITGRVVGFYRGDPTPYPIAGWSVELDIHRTGDPNRYVFSTTNPNGEFALSDTVTDVEDTVRIFARSPRGSIYDVAFWDSLDVQVPMDGEITLDYTDYSVNQIVHGYISFRPEVDIGVGGDYRLSMGVQIVGPAGENPKTFLLGINSGLSSYGLSGYGYMNWQVPPTVEAGKYQIRAQISGPYFDPFTVVKDFHILDAVPTNLEVNNKAPADRWTPGSIVGTFTDFNGAPIPNAQVRATAQDMISGKSVVELPLTTTDQNGQFEISLEMVDAEHAKSLSNYRNGPWQIVVYADKEGYSTGAAILTVSAPTVQNGAWIVDVSTPLNHLTRQTIRFDQPLPFSTHVRIRYNAWQDNMVLTVGTEGNWRVESLEVNRFSNVSCSCGALHEADVKVNGVPLPRFEVYTGHLEQMRRWHVDGTHIGYPYFYPRATAHITVTEGLGQEIEVPIEGTLFDFNYHGCEQPNPCGGGNLIPDNPAVPPPYASGVHIEVSLGGQGDSVRYSLGSSPAIRIDGNAWVSERDGKFRGQARLTQAIMLPNLLLNLQAIEKEKAGGQEKPGAVLSVAASVRTDQDGKFELSLTIGKDPCELIETTEFIIRVSPADVTQTIDIPVELRCIPEVEFKIDSAPIIQATDLSEINPLRLVNHKPAGVRVQVKADGQIFQPPGRPVNVTVQFTAEIGGQIVSQQEKILSISETGASVAWAPKSARPNNAGIGAVATRTPDGNKEGDDTYPVDFVFRPDLAFPGPKDADLKITIVVDPEKKYGDQQEHTIEGTVYASKLLILKFVPVDVPNVDMAFIERQVRFIAETYPIDEWFILWWVEPNYPSADMPSEFTFSWLNQVTGALEDRHGTPAGAYSLSRIIGVVDNDTWLKGWFDSGAAGATGVHITGITGGTRQAVLVRYPNAQEYTTAHELGHSLGLYLGRGAEQYEETMKLVPASFDGIQVEGPILKNGQIYQPPAEAFHATAPDVLFVYDLMGSAQSDSHVVNEQRAWIIPSTYDHILGQLADPPGDPVLFVRGVVAPDNSFTVTSLQAAEGLAEAAFETGDFELQLRSSGGEVLHSTRFGETGIELPVAFTIPYHPATARLVIVHKGDVLAQVHRSPNAPTIDLSTPSGVDAEGKLALDWSAEDPDGEELESILSYHCDDDPLWRQIAADLTGPSYELDTSRLHGGESCTVRLAANDGFNVTEAVSAPFAVADKPPLVTILTEATSFEEGQTIILEASAYDPEAGFLPAEQTHWFSGDGEIGNDDYIALMLPAGTHTITFRAEDSAGQVAEGSITITVSPSSSPSSEDSIAVTVSPSSSPPLTDNLMEWLPYIIGFGFLVLLAFSGGLIMVYLFMRRRRKLAAAPAPGPGGIEQTVSRDARGRYWSQEPTSGRWLLWDGQTWQPAPGPTGRGSASPPAKPQGRARRNSCLLSLIIMAIIAVLVTIAIGLLAFGFVPGVLLPETSNVDRTTLLGVLGGTVVSIGLGGMMIRGGVRALVTGRAWTDDAAGHLRETKGCPATLSGFVQLLLGLLFFSLGVAAGTATAFAQALPWLVKVW